MHNNNTLVFFSTGYPYETTLKREFQVLSQNFDRIYYFPTNLGNGKKEPLPDNFILNTLLAETSENWKRISVKQWLLVFSLYFSALILKGNIIPYLRGMKTYLTIAARNVVWASRLEKFITENKLEHALYYDYWFENATLCLALLKRKRIIQEVMSRSHRFDLYDESWPQGKVPFREFKVRNLDAVFTVAQHGQEYFKSKVANSLRHKIKLSYLGVEIPEIIEFPAKRSNEKLIVSASNTREFKRVHHIPEILSQIGLPVRWIHFGTGPMDDVIAEKISKLPPHIRAEQRGFVPNEEVLKFFSENHVDLFLSLSSSEGLPISMMEAIAHGVPVFACNVCGIPDLVNKETGVMFESGDDNREIARRLSETLNIQFKQREIHEFAAEKFSYLKNYNSFIQELKNLCQYMLKNHWFQ